MAPTKAERLALVDKEEWLMSCRHLTYRLSA